MSNDTMTNQDVYSEVTEQILEGIEQVGPREWEMPWDGMIGRPRNLDGRPYNGINILLLNGRRREEGFDSNQWGTYKAALHHGEEDEETHVEKGSTSQKIVFWKMRNIEVVVDENGVEQNNLSPSDVDDGDDYRVEEKSIPLCRLYSLFNTEQMEGVKSDTAEKESTVEAAEEFLEACPADVEHGDYRPHYDRKDETIRLPAPSEFDSIDDYIGTAAHEAIHATEDLLDREKASKSNREEYAKEELIAEIGSAFICAEVGAEKSTKSAAHKYVRNWISSLEDDEYAIFEAAKKAEEAVELLKELTGGDDAFSAA